MSLCDTCKSPGACCKRISLSVVETGLEIYVWLDMPIEEQIAHRMGGFNGFSPQSIKEQWDDPSGRPYGSVYLQCDNLLPDGRCSIYDARPDLCRDYVPGSDKLCVHYGAAP